MVLRAKTGNVYELRQQIPPLSNPFPFQPATDGTEDLSRPPVHALGPPAATPLPAAGGLYLWPAGLGLLWTEAQCRPGQSNPPRCSAGFFRKRGRQVIGEGRPNQK